MKSSSWFGLSLLSCALVVGSLKVILPTTPAPADQHPPEQAESNFDAVAMFEAGMKAVAAKDLTRGDYLTQMALRRQMEQPEAVGLIWNRFRSYLDDQKLASHDRLIRLTIYRDSVEAALMGCRKQHDFENVWAVRQNVVAAVREAHRALYEQATRKVADFQKNAAGLLPLAALQAFARLQADLEPQLATLFTTSAEGVPANTEVIFKPIGELVTTAVAERIQIEQQAEDLADQGVKEGKVETAEEDKAGPCEKLMHQLQDFCTALEQAQLARWLVLNKDETSQAKLVTLNRDLVRVQGKLAKLQHLRYNLWALRQIYTAETGLNWDASLGRIDVGLLHPTAAALYSSAYDSRIKKEDDPLNRIRTVQQILNRKRVPLTAF